MDSLPLEAFAWGFYAMFGAALAVVGFLFIVFVIVQTAIWIEEWFTVLRFRWKDRKHG